VLLKFSMLILLHCRQCSQSVMGFWTKSVVLGQFWPSCCRVGHRRTARNRFWTSGPSVSFTSNVVAKHALRCTVS